MHLTPPPLLLPPPQYFLGKMGVVEDILLGPTSLLQAEGMAKWQEGKVFDLGDHPPRVSGIKVYQSDDDEAILELPMMWGASAQVGGGRGGPCGSSGE